MAPLPLIKLTLGDNIETIQRQSSFPFPTRSLGKIDVIGAAEPITFEYSRSQCGFTLPPARSFAAAVNEGHAVSVTVSPQLTYVSLSQALDLIGGLQSLLEQSHWVLTRRYKTFDDVRAALTDASRQSDLTLRLEDWRCQEDEVYIELARHWRAGESLPESSGQPHDFCVVSLKIENDAVRAKYPGY